MHQCFDRRLFRRGERYMQVCSPKSLNLESELWRPLAQWRRAGTLVMMLFLNLRSQIPKSSHVSNASSIIALKPQTSKLRPQTSGLRLLFGALLERNLGLRQTSDLRTQTSEFRPQKHKSVHSYCSPTTSK